MVSLTTFLPLRPTLQTSLLEILPLLYKRYRGRQVDVEIVTEHTGTICRAFFNSDHLLELTPTVLNAILNEVIIVNSHHVITT